MISNLQVKGQRPTCSEPKKLFQKEDMKRKAPAKARCYFFGCQEEAVIDGMCQWHYRYEHYESK